MKLTVDPPTLTPTQQKILPQLERSMERHRIYANQTPPGGGKTHVEVIQILEGDFDATVIAPLAVHASWEAVFNDFGVSPEKYQILSWQKAAKAEENFKPFGKNPRVVFDEAHRGKGGGSNRGRGTKQSRLMAAVARKYPAAILSGSLMTSPMDSRAILHATGVCNWGDWYKLLPNLGCFQNEYMNGAWVWNGRPEGLAKLQDLLMPFSYATPYSEIREMNDLVVTAVDVPIKGPGRFNFDSTDRQHLSDNQLLGRMQTMRVDCELLKVPAVVEKMKEALEQGVKPVLFCNFNSSINLATDLLETDWVITGATDKARRDEIVAEFQTGKKLKPLIVNSATMSEGVSLHDLEGIQRVCYVMPNYSAQSLLQITGRTRRVNAKSDAIYELQFAAGTFESRIASALRKKLIALETFTQESLNMTAITAIRDANNCAYAVNTEGADK